MANKKLQFTSGSPKTPRLQIFKQPDGNYTITYAKSDPLGLRSETTSDLDSEIRRLFGYSGWQEYKQKNMTDLTKKIIKDPESGKVTQAPTLHPFHVAYGLEEFVENLDPEDYEVVAIPAKSKLLNEVVDPLGILEPDPEEDAARAEEEARKEDRKNNPQDKFGDIPSATDVKKLETLNGVIQQRRLFFGNAAAENSKEKLGILNISAFFPQEQLANKEVLARAKNQFNFKDIFTNIFGEEVAVKHPSGKYWKSGFRVFADTTEDVSDAHKVDASEILSSTSMLYEQAAPQLSPAPAPSTPKPNLRVVPDPAPRPPVAYPGSKVPLTAANDNAIKKVAEGPAKKTIQQLPKIIAKKAAAKGAVAAIPMVGWVLAAGLLVWDIYEITGWLVENWDDVKGWLADVIGVESYTVLDDAISDAAPAMDPVPPLVTDLPDAGPVPVSPENVTTDPSVGVPPIAQPVPVPAPAGDAAISPAPVLPPGATGWPPLLPIIPSDLNYHIVPVGWETGRWLTKAEDVLSQRIGANTNFSFGSAPVEDKTPKDDKQSAGSINENSKALIFGHSQTARFAKAIKKEFLSAGGGSTKTYTFGSNQDGDVGSEKHPGLVNQIKKVKGKYTHAFLFLGGNTSSNNHFEAKKEIIRYVIQELNVPKENIVVSLPPINLDNKFSQKRGEDLYKRTEAFFNSMGIKVHPKITGNKKHFSVEKDKPGVHIRSTSSLVKNSAAAMVSSFASPASDPSVAVTTQSGRSSRKRVDPLDLYNYLISKGVSSNHAIGMINNARYESNFKIGSVGDKVDMVEAMNAPSGKAWRDGYVVYRKGRGYIYAHPKSAKYKQKVPESRKKNIVATSGGIWAWHNAGAGFESGRFTNMKKFVGSDWRTDWKGQADFCLTENLTKKYLSKKFNSPEDASQWFTYYWEAPLDRKNKQYSRLKTIEQYKKFAGQRLTESIFQLIGEVENELV